jgi:hypothetical protein
MGAGVPLRYKLRRVEGEPVPANVLEEPDADRNGLVPEGNSVGGVEGGGRGNRAGSRSVQSGTVKAGWAKTARVFSGAEMENENMREFWLERSRQDGAAQIGTAMTSGKRQSLADESRGATQ